MAGPDPRAPLRRAPPAYCTCWKHRSCQVILLNNPTSGAFGVCSHTSLNASHPTGQDSGRKQAALRVGSLRRTGECAGRGAAGPRGPPTGRGALAECPGRSQHHWPQKSRSCNQMQCPCPPPFPPRPLPECAGCGGDLPAPQV